MKQSYIFFTLFALISFKGIAQTNYAVNSIPFQYYSGALTPLSSADDTFSAPITLPFFIDFFGFNYNQINVSTNGYIAFGMNYGSGSFSNWTLNAAIPNVNNMLSNSVLGCFEDLNNSIATGTITYGVYGTAPYRKFVVSFNNQPHFQCTTILSTFQIVLSETSSIIDINIASRQPCTGWQSGNGVTGIVNHLNSIACIPPGRNTGPWTATNESWRYSRPGYYQRYDFVRCDDDDDGAQIFDLSVAANDISANPSGISFFADIALTMPIGNPTAFQNTNNPQIIYAAGNGVMKEVRLEVINCSVDADSDTVPTADEDVNSDTNLANDDTDNDGIPNYLDNDDDGDMVLTSLEYVFNKTNTNFVNALLDTDNDGIPNYLDNDDDGDGLLTSLEDYNGDGDPTNDDTNANGLPDYLDSSVALGTPSTTLSNTIQLYPNPVSTELNIQALDGKLISNIEIYSVNGSLIKEVKSNNTYQNISVSELQTGMYFVRVTANERVSNLKFIKQ